MLVCVSDFVVDEYMVGTGSDNLTFFTYDALGWFDIPDFDSSDTSSDYSYEIFASGIERKVAEPLEGPRMGGLGRASGESCGKGLGHGASLARRSNFCGSQGQRLRDRHVRG